MAIYKIDFSHCRIKPYDHQKIGVRKIFENRWFFLADEMGAGKTKQTIDAAQFLFQHGFIDKVLVVCPASVRPVWFDSELGELSKHLWISQAGRVTEFHSHPRSWVYGDQSKPRLQWVITNYDFIRSKSRLQQMLQFCSNRTMLVLDESSAVKSYKALQSTSCLALRNRCGRVVLLNGTPISNNPGDLFSQANIMHPSVLSCKNWWQFRARYGVLGGWKNKKIVKWVNLEDLQNRLAPFTLRRLKKDCLDLPEKLPPVSIAVPLEPKTWNLYKQMKDDFVTWISTHEVSMAQQAITKALRMAQMTSGFLGGIEDEDEYSDGLLEDDQEPPPVRILTEEIGREKLDAFIQWYKERLEEEPNFKLLVWCRFKPEAHRLRKEIDRLFGTSSAEDNTEGVKTGMIIGQQKRGERAYALRLLDPRTAPVGPAVVVGTPQSGSMGLNLTAAHTVVYMSNDYSLKTRLQSEDRVHRPGQTKPVSYFNFVATGPKGQKTIDHHILKVLEGKDDLANMTTSAWVQALNEDVKAA